MLDSEEAGTGVDRHEQVPLILLEPGDRPRALGPCIVEQDVEATQHFCALLDQRLYVALFGYVSGDELCCAALTANFLDHTPAVVLVDIGHNDGRTFLSKRSGGD